MLQQGAVNRLGERLATAGDVAEAIAIVRKAVRAAGMSSCELVGPGEPRTHRFGVDIPILDPRGVVAMLACRGRVAVTRACERKLVIIAMHLSVWWTTRHLDAAPHGDRLTPRQHRIAQLAALGRTNAEIARMLDVSVNTVKARLKEAFDRLGVNNRTELANALPRLASTAG